MAELRSCCAESARGLPGRTRGWGCAMKGCSRTSPAAVCVGVGRVGLNTGAPSSASPFPGPGILHANVSVIISSPGWLRHPSKRHLGVSGKRQTNRQTAQKKQQRKRRKKMKTQQRAEKNSISRERTLSAKKKQRDSHNLFIEKEKPLLFIFISKEKSVLLLCFQ